MVSQKLLDLILKLDRKTASGDISWEKTIHENVFQTSFPRYTIRVSHDRRGGNYAISILGMDGNVIESVKDTEIETGAAGDARATWRNRLQGIFKNARHQACGVDHALDELMAYLD